MTQKVLHEQSSDVGLQNGVLRNRVPTNILTAIGAEAVGGGKRGSDAIRWQAIQDGDSIYIVGELKKRAAQGRQVPLKTTAAKTPAKAAAKTAAKRPTKAATDDLESAFDDRPAANTRPAPPVRRQVAPAVPVAPARPAVAAVSRPVPPGAPRYPRPVRR
jgi:hypothetical protein